MVGILLIAVPARVGPHAPPFFSHLAGTASAAPPLPIPARICLRARSHAAAHMRAHTHVVNRGFGISKKGFGTRQRASTFCDVINFR